jgi:hypothetical protein
MLHQRDPTLTDPLSIPAARMVVTALRAANGTLEGLDPRCADIVFDSFADMLGDVAADAAGGAMIALARRMRAAGGLDALPIGCRHVTADELLVLAAVGGLAARDDLSALDVERLLAARGISGARRLFAVLAREMGDAGVRLGRFPVPLAQGRGRADPTRCGAICPRHGAALPAREITR